MPLFKRLSKFSQIEQAALIQATVKIGKTPSEAVQLLWDVDGDQHDVRVLRRDDPESGADGRDRNTEVAASD